MKVTALLLVVCPLIVVGSENIHDDVDIQNQKTLEDEVAVRRAWLDEKMRMYQFGTQQLEERNALVQRLERNALELTSDRTRSVIDVQAHYFIINKKMEIGKLWKIASQRKVIEWSSDKARLTVEQQELQERIDYLTAQFEAGETFENEHYDDDADDDDDVDAGESSSDDLTDSVS